MMEIWTHLSTLPLFGLTLTLLVYTIAHKLYLISHANPLCNPVLISMVVIISFLWFADIEYALYFDGAKYIHYLLGPATVALAVPLYQQLPMLKKIFLPLMIAITGGILIGVTSAIVIARMFGASVVTQLSLAPKSVTTPIAMSISEYLGGLPSLTASLVILSGITGALIAGRLFALVGITDEVVKGVALGVTSHGVGTARAFQISQKMGAFSGIAMALTAFLSAIILPWLALWFF